VNVVSPAGLTRGEILRLVNNYIGVEGGYLADFTYGSHCEFYPMYCDLDLDPFHYLPDGTTRERFITVLEQTPPDVQAKILRGVLLKYPAGSGTLRTQAAHDAIAAMAERLEHARMAGMVTVPAAVTSEVVVRAIQDAETLLKQGGGPTSAVDRVHTALHGHLGYLCEQAGIEHDREDTMVALLKKLRKEHPNLQDLGPRETDITTVLKASGSILDALNPVRNNASVAHPNQDLVGWQEAQLVINVAWSLLGYLDAKIALAPKITTVSLPSSDYPYEAYDELNDR
jgi:hypothetical protein